MKKTILSLPLLFIFLTGCIHSDTIKGYWTGNMEMNGKTVDIAIVFNNNGGTFTCQDMILLNEPLSNLKLSNGTISFLIALDVRVTFMGVIENEKIKGTVNIEGGPPGITINYSLEKKSNMPPVKPYCIEKLIVKSKNANLSAEIYKPKSAKLHPALIMLHGSSTNLKREYTFYADYFANLGIEVMIFDKRGNGESTGNYATADYQDFVEDAISCLENIKNRENIDKNKIGLWGFSQGASLLPLIVAKTSIPAFLIAKSPEVFSFAEAGAYSDSLRLSTLGYSSINGHIAAESHRHVRKMILKGSNYKEVQSFIYQNALKYSFMNQTGLYGNITISKDDFEGYYWKGRVELLYPYWKNIKIPTIVLFGENDEYLDALRNNNLLTSLNNRNIATKLFPNANHSLKKTFNPAEKSDFDWPRVIPEYLDFITEWVSKELSNKG